MRFPPLARIKREKILREGLEEIKIDRKLLALLQQDCTLSFAGTG